MKALKTICAVVCGLAAILLSAQTAVAIQPYRTVFTLAPQGGFERPAGGVAIDQSNGNVYAADDNSGAVDVFGSGGGAPADGGTTQLDGFVFGSEPGGVAIDNACAEQEPPLSGSACQAFDPDAGDLYVANTFGGAVERLRPNGGGSYESTTSFPFSYPTGVAVDAHGDLYVANYYETAISELKPSGEEVKLPQTLIEHPSYVAVSRDGQALYVGAYGGAGVAKLQLSAGGTVTSEAMLAPYGGAVALAPDGQVFVDQESTISVYSPTGALEAQFGAVEGSRGLAVNETNGLVYVANPGGHDLLAFGATPQVSTNAPTLESGRAQLGGTVEPEGKQVTACHFEYGRSSELSQSVPCAQTLPLTGEAPVPISPAIAGLHTRVTYYYWM